MPEPTASQIAAYLASAAHRGSDDEIEVFETDTNEPDGEFIMLFDFDGAEFGCRVKVMEVEEQ